MFAQIILHDLSKSLQSRAKGRKVCGPYLWAPSKAGQGRGFYTGPDGQCARHGAGFRLRLEDANAHISGRLSMTTGYFCDSDGDGDTLQPIIARLPRGRGFLAGWTMGEGMASALGASIFEDEADAAHEAHRMAQRDAEASQESDQSDDEEDSDDDATGYGEGYGEFQVREPVFPELYSCNAFGSRVCHIDGRYSVMDLRESEDAKAGELEPWEMFDVCYDGGAILPGGSDGQVETLGAALRLIDCDKLAALAKGV